MAEPRERRLCRGIKKICGRGLCGICYERVRRAGELHLYAKDNASHRKRYVYCVDCGEYSLHGGKERCGKCYRKWYCSQPEIKARHAENMRKWRHENPEKAKAIEERRSGTRKRKRWAERYRKEYRAKNREALNEYWRNWNREHPEKDAAAYARKKNASGEMTGEQWTSIVNFYCPDGKCPSCGEAFDSSDIRRRLTVDHVIPLNLGGTHWPHNIQPLCCSCNCSKSDLNCNDYRLDNGKFARELMNESLDDTASTQH